MSQRSLSTDGFRLTLLAAIASFGCASESGGGPTTKDTTTQELGLKECVPESDHGYPGSGVVLCNGDFLHREQALECHAELLRPGQDGYPASRQDAAVSSGCFVDADCHSAPDGYCVLQGDRLVCAYGCRQDSDCAANELCLCGTELAGNCVLAECRTDADCPEGSLCTGPKDLRDIFPVHFACQQAVDRCAGDGDCTENTCHYTSKDGFRTCPAPPPSPGRPFLVEGQARTARVASRADWLASLPDEAVTRAPALSDAERERVVQHWLRAGQLEHASVAAFARFSLQLLRVGAPAHLLQAACAAQSDEIRHAKAAFAVASCLQGAPLGPGPLALGDLDLHESLEEILVGTILEGCVGETLAALEAADALAAADHPLARRALEGVAADEARHAELAWSFVAWLLAREGPRLLPSARAAFARARDQHSDTEASKNDRLARFGVLSRARSAQVRRDAWASVIEPCWGALQVGLGGAGQGVETPAGAALVRA